MTITTQSAGNGRFAQLAVAAHVVETIRLSPHTSLVRLAVGTAYQPFEPGEKVKLAVPGGRPKSYTPARLKNGVLDIVFELHGHGPTARWAEHAVIGEMLWITRALSSLRVPPGAWWFVGDATTLGLAVSLHEDPRYDLQGVLELGETDAAAVENLGLPLLVVPPGQASRVSPSGAVQAVVAGEAGLVAEVHRALTRKGIKNVLTKPYWSKRGGIHRKFVALTTGGGR